MEKEIEMLFEKENKTDIGDLMTNKGEYLDKLSKYEKKRKLFVDQYEELLKNDEEFDEKKQSKRFKEIFEKRKKKEKENKEFKGKIKLTLKKTK